MRSDSALAERVTGGDEAAFDVLYERHRAVVLAVAMGVLGTTHDAEDATQETFSALAVALRTKPPAELRPWLIRVARNAAIDTTRRRRHRLLTLDGELPEVQARPIGGGKAELAVVFDGIRELPEGQRMALLMRELGGHSYSEIAEFLETDEDAVKGLIARARVGLRAFREASELSCASARSTIAAEPDGRRYDKTVRRHLRTCASCRSYRDALRDDAKALRAGLPLQAGGVAAGTGISAGPLAAAKGAMVGYSLTQAAAACAASACAVGAVGGIVLIGPVHRFGIPPILSVPKHAKVHQAAAKLATTQKHLKVSTHPQVTEQQAADGAAIHTAAMTAGASRHAAAVSHATAAIKHHHRDHHSVTVKRSTVHLKVAPTTSPVTLSAGSGPIITPAPSAPAQTQPVTQSTQPPAQTQPVTQSTQPPAQTTTATPNPAQSTSASPSATQTAGSSPAATQGPGTSPAVAQGSGIDASPTTPQTPGTSTGTAASPSAVSSATTPTTGTSTTPTTGITTTPTTGASTTPTTWPSTTTPTTEPSTTTTTTTTTSTTAPPSSTTETPPAATTPAGTSTTPTGPGTDTATPPADTAGAATGADAGTDSATTPFDVAGTPTE
jgi:RNA polymerase sigma factor (sigma-70 family)